MSTDVQHTPGRWWVERRVGGSLQVNAKHRGEGSSYCVATVNHWEGDADRANARLIACAPDLLALAKQYASECCDCNYGHGATGKGSEGQPCEECSDIRAVIDRAEGRS